jgi:hypothetical protein
MCDRGSMRKRAVKIGEEFQGGRVQRILRPDRHRHQCVSFVCSACRHIGKCRYSDLRSGVQGSCGCLKKAAFLAFLTRRADSLPPTLRKAIWAYGENNGLESTWKRYAKALCEHGLGRLTPNERKALLNYIWRTEGVRVFASVPKSTRELWFAAMLRTGLVKTATQYGIAKETVLRICRTMNRSLLCARATKQLTVDKALQLAHSGNDLMREARLNGYRGEWYRQCGEFTRKEFTGLSRASKRSFRAAYEMLRVASRQGLPGDDHETVEEFLFTCERTLRGRKQRSDYFNGEAVRARAAQFTDFHFRLD